MQIVIEYSLLINFLINFFIIKSVGYVYKIRPKFIILASLVGASIAVALPYFNLKVWANIVVTMLLALAINLCCFDVKPLKKFLLTCLSFLGITFLFGGACFAVQSRFGGISLVAVLLICAVVYIIASFIFKHNNKVRRLAAFVYDVEIDANGQRIVEEGYLDSGNMLYDPIVKKPIVLINFEVFSKIYKDISYLSLFVKKVPVEKLEKGHYIKINSVACSSSILVFNAKSLVLKSAKEEKTFHDVCLGISLSGFEKSLGKNVLLHSEFA